MPFVAQVLASMHGAQENGNAEVPRRHSGDRGRRGSRAKIIQLALARLDGVLGRLALDGAREHVADQVFRQHFGRLGIRLTGISG